VFIRGKKEAQVVTTDDATHVEIYGLRPNSFHHHIFFSFVVEPLQLQMCRAFALNQFTQLAA
jgi:hypothetical protein